MKFNFLSSFYVFVKHVCSVRKTPEWSLCLLISSNIVYSAVGVIWQPSYCMCDVMFLDIVPVFLEEIAYHEI